MTFSHSNIELGAVDYFYRNPRAALQAYNLLMKRPAAPAADVREPAAKPDLSEARELLDWFAEPNFNHVHPPHKWTLQIHSELRRLVDLLECAPAAVLPTSDANRFDQRIAELSQLQQGWDGGSAATLRPGSSAMLRAHLMQHALPTNANLFMTREGTLELQWESNGGDVYLQFVPDAARTAQGEGDGNG